MCFSPTASFVAGVSLVAIGVVTLKKAKHKNEIPFAAVPLLFGIQQCVEGFVWLSFGWNNSGLNAVASHIFYFFSNVWWPVFAPLAILLIETVPWRKKVMWFFEAAGIFTGVYFLYCMIASPLTSAVVNSCIVYTQPHIYVGPIAVLYVIATCAGCFFSSKKTVNLLGALMVLSLGIAYIFYTWALISVWCFFAAALSIVIYLYFNRNGNCR